MSFDHNLYVFSCSNSDKMKRDDFVEQDKLAHQQNLRRRQILADRRRQTLAREREVEDREVERNDRINAWILTGVYVVFLILAACFFYYLWL